MTQKRFRRLFMGASGLMLMASVQAGIPVWTYSAPNPAQVTVSAGSSATVQYTVTNQSTRTKNLILKATPGLSASPCYLAGKGSSCTVTLTVNGSQIPEQGLHAGPIMCEQGNPNQCYQPGAGNVLNVVKGNSPPVTDAVISLNPSSVTFTAGDTSSLITLTNTSSIVANGLNITPSANLSLASNTCGATLAPQASCQFSVTSTVVSTGNSVSIHGSNTNSVVLGVTVTAASNTTLSVTAITSPAVIAVNPASGVQLSIENTGSTTAYSVVYTLPSGWNGVSSGSCGDIPPAPGPGNTCTLTFNATQPNVTNTIGFSANNAAVVQSPPIAFSYQGYLVYAVTPTSSTTGTVYVVNTADSGTSQWDSTYPDCNNGELGTSTCAVTNATSLTDGQYADSLGNTYKIITTIGTQNPPYSTNAAGACYNITTSSGNAVPQGTWYLPAKDELNNICVNLRSLGFGGFSTGYYWSSAEYSDTSGFHCPSAGACAWFQWLGFGDCSPQVAQPKSYPGSQVRCSQAIVY